MSDVKPSSLQMPGNAALKGGATGLKPIDERERPTWELKLPPPKAQRESGSKAAALQKAGGRGGRGYKCKRGNAAKAALRLRLLAAGRRRAGSSPRTPKSGKAGLLA